MKKLFLIGVFLLATVFLAACGKTNGSVSITSNVDKYTPTMSSVQGFTLTPNFRSDQKYHQLEYHWLAEKGSFISQFAPSRSELTNEGEAVLWSAVEQDQLVDIKNDFQIVLEVIDGENGAVLAQTELTIEVDQGFYEVGAQK